MQREPGIKWMFLDLNSYFASVEQQDNPALRGKPLAVVPMMTDFTCAIAASYEAKIYGIKTGTSVLDAKRLCPNIHFVLARHDRYVFLHHKVISEIALHAPINQVCSIDELSSRLPPSKRSLDCARNIAQNIKSGLQQNVGTHIKASIGFAPNSLLAKIAADMKKPDGLTIIQQEDLPDALFHLKLMDIPGIGRNIRNRLNIAGIHSVEDFWNTSPKHVRRIWGSVEGERLWYLLHGYDIERPAQKNVMIGHSRVLDPELRTPDKAYAMIRKLTEKAAHRLRSNNYFCKSIFLSSRTTDGYKFSCAIDVQAAQDTITLLQHIDALWAHMMKHLSKQSYIPDLRFKKISIILTDLLQKHDITDDLLHTGFKETKIKLQKREALTSALDKLQEKYRQNVVSFGVAPKTLGGFVGTKIAFNRVPKTEEFWD